MALGSASITSPSNSTLSSLATSYASPPAGPHARGRPLVLLLRRLKLPARGARGRAIRGLARPRGPVNGPPAVMAPLPRCDREAAGRAGLAAVRAARPAQAADS